MKFRSLSILIIALALAPASSHAATTLQPGYDTFAEPTPDGQPNVAPQSPHVPAYLPDGATNLDSVWTQDGGARLYWNSVVIPQQLKMAGATWVDPALVPELITTQPKVHRKRYYPKRRRVAAKRKVTARAPVNAASTALTPPPAIPLPVTQVPQRNPIPPLGASGNEIHESVDTDFYTPPRLQ